ncbi:calcium-binding protein [Marinivivus vitaminiproducens]|uniref:calcium-binding protein n=1 Tax=Marinivivus vitaminiproducens TaxID=3035935 RepID=UPI0027A3A91A|nr:calcium-binding protein [Geminicoccaceae bacterium SCSIO 64248]
MRFTPTGTFGPDDRIVDPLTGQVISVRGRASSNLVYEATDSDQTLTGGNAFEGFVYDLTLDGESGRRFDGFTTISAGAGHDIIDLTVRPDNASEAYDTPIDLIGGLGDDIILTGSSASLSGRAYGDGVRLAMNTTGGHDKLFGGDGIDVLYGDAALSSNAFGGDDQLFGRGGDDVLYGDSQEALTPWGPSQGDDHIYGGPGNDTLYGDGFRSPIRGGDDVLKGASGDDEIYGDVRIASAHVAGGNDFIEAGDGNDSVYGDARILVGEGGNDVIDGGDGDDRLYGDAARADEEWAPDGNLDDLLIGGDDVIYGGDGVDRIYGDASFMRYSTGGDDIIDSGPGDDILYGEGFDAAVIPGADTFIFEPGDGMDWIRDFQPGIDTIDLSAWGFADFEDLTIRNNGSNTVYVDLAEGDQLQIEGRADQVVRVTVTAEDFILA